MPTKKKKRAAKPAHILERERAAAEKEQAIAKAKAAKKPPKRAKNWQYNYVFERRNITKSVTYKSWTPEELKDAIDKACEGLVGQDRKGPPNIYFEQSHDYYDGYSEVEFYAAGYRYLTDDEYLEAKVERSLARKREKLHKEEQQNAARQRRREALEAIAEEDPELMKEFQA